MKPSSLAVIATIVLCTAAPAGAQYAAPPQVHVTQPRIVMPPGVTAQPRVRVQQPNVQRHHRSHRYYCSGAIAGPPNGTGPVYGQPCALPYTYGPYSNFGPYSSFGGTTVYTVLWGTISEVDGSVIALQLDGQPSYESEASSIVRIDVQEALSHDQAGRLDVGRHVMAYGYWQSGVFFAIRLA